MLDQVAQFVRQVVLDLGYPGLFLLIVLESTVVPVPSLLVMPFAGYLASTGDFSLPVILVINSLGALVGSSISYGVGAAGGKPLLLRYGKWIFVRPADIEKTEQWFAKNGAWTVLIGRFLPVIRHIISIPAGIARMNFGTFLLQTFLGSTLWGGGLMVVGYLLGKQWESVMKVAKKFDLAFALIVVGLLLAGAALFIIRRRRANRAAGTPPPSP